LATAKEFARRGETVALLGRDGERLGRATKDLLDYGVRAAAFPVDTADAKAVETAAAEIEATLGPIDVWINNAMATVFSPVSALPANEIKRVTEVTYLGTVYGTMAALRRMTPRGKGIIINVGSALAYRSVPLQAAYCGAKSAIRGFTDSLRSELIHDKLDIQLTMVHLPAVNTPQFSWAKNRTGHGARPMAPVYQPEVAARAIAYAASVKRREVWVGFSTLLAILANRIAPSLADRYLARAGYEGQFTAANVMPDAPSNLFEPVPGNFGAHGAFDDKAKTTSWELFTTEHRYLIFAAAMGALYGLHRVVKRFGV
jgi:short-subunit dehydrogenase